MNPTFYRSLPVAGRASAWPWAFGFARAMGLGPRAKKTQTLFEAIRAGFPF
jgi:hypothetical protein